MKISTHASEGLTHWYSKSGEPAYEVRGANGNMRPATLRDARKLGLVPSVTGIIRCAAAPGLEIWKAQQVLHAALTLPLIPGEPEADYLARIMRDSKEQARVAATRGTAIHACLQAFYQHEDWGQYSEHVIGANNALNKHFGVAPWGAEQSFSHPMGFGGKVDLFCLGLLCDFKTKEFDEDSKLSTFDEHAMQLAAYREGLGMPQARCAIVYVSVTVPGLARVIEIPQAELANGWAMFQGLLQYWKAKNSYDPARQTETA